MCLNDSIDLSTVAVGKGRATKRIPLVQINTVMFLSKHAHELDLNTINSLIGDSNSGVSFKMFFLFVLGKLFL